MWRRIKEHLPSVCLYVVSSVSEEARRTAILEWCLTNQFELIETEAEDEGDEDEEEDDFGDKEGKARIASALKAHTWSNLELLEDTSGAGADQAHSEQATASGSEDEDIDFETLFSQLRWDIARYL